eukprot:scaffold64203_cov32-Tisochrysis_lutea.AAC.2
MSARKSTIHALCPLLLACMQLSIISLASIYCTLPKLNLALCTRRRAIESSTTIGGEAPFVCAYRSIIRHRSPS